MQEYELIDENKTIGKIKYFKNIKDNNIISTKKDSKYIIVNNLQTYLIDIILNNEDDLYDIVNTYKKENIFEEMDYIKKYNNIHKIKNNTKIQMIVPYKTLDKLNKKLEDININSLINNKINFIKRVLENVSNDNIFNNLNNIIEEYNNFISSNEFEFLDKEEIDTKFNQILVKIDNIIKIIEKETKYRYQKDFIEPIKID